MEYYGESLDLLIHVENICKQMYQLYNFQEVRAGLNTIINLPHKEIKKYYCSNKLYVLDRDDNFADIELIQLATTILDKLKIKYKIQYNYLGCNECYDKYKQSITDELFKIGKSTDNLNNLDDLSNLDNLTSKLDLCNACKKNKESLENGLTIYFPNASYNNQFSKYNQLTFNICEEKTNTVLFTGGRLNNILTCEMNTDNVLKFIHLYKNEYTLDVLILLEKYEYRHKAFDLLKTLRDNNYRADAIMTEKTHKLLYTRKYLTEHNARVIIIFEPKQIKKDLIVIKDLNNDTINAMPIVSVIPILNGMFNKY